MGETRTKLESFQASAPQTPIDSEDSDPDFVNNATYEYERKPKRGKKKKGEAGSLAKTKQSNQQASSSKHQLGKRLTSKFESSN